MRRNKSKEIQREDIMGPLIRAHCHRDLQEIHAALSSISVRARSEETLLVDYHKRLLGKQSYCFDGSEHRFWVWESDGWAVAVSNRKGICFEVPFGTSAGDALKMWRSYYTKMKRGKKTRPNIKDQLIDFFETQDPDKSYVVLELTRITESSRDATRRALGRLVKEGKIRKVGRGRWGPK